MFSPSSFSFDFFFCSSTVAFDSFKANELIEWFESLHILQNEFVSSSSDANDNSAHSQRVKNIQFEFISLVEDIILNEKDSEGRDFVIRLFHPSFIKRLVSRIVVLKITVEVSSSSAAADDVVDDDGKMQSNITNQIEKILLREITKNLQNDFVYKIFKYPKDSELVRKFLKHFIFNDEATTTPPADDGDGAFSIEVSRADGDGDGEGNAFFIEYKPEDTSSSNSSAQSLPFQKIRIPILLTEREYYKCTRGLELIDEEKIVFDKKTNIPLYFHTEKKEECFLLYKHPYPSIPFWFSNEKERIFEQIRNENIEEYDFERDILKGVLDESDDFLLSNSFMLSFVDPQLAASGISISPVTAFSSPYSSPRRRGGGNNNVVRGGRRQRKPTQTQTHYHHLCVKQKIRFVVNEIFKAFHIDVRCDSVYVNHVYCRGNDNFTFSLYGGIQQAFKMVWNGLLPVVEIEMKGGCAGAPLFLAAASAAASDVKKELLYSVALISFVKTFVGGGSLSRPPPQLKYLFDHLSVDCENSLTIKVPLWSFESVVLFVKTFKTNFEDIILKNNYSIVSTAENPKCLFDPSQPSIYFKESQIKIYFGGQPSKETYSIDFSRHCSNDSDPVSLDSFETDLTDAEKHEVVFMGVHGYRLETLEKIIETEKSISQLPLTREPILETIGSLRQRISGVLKHRDNQGLVSYYFSRGGEKEENDKPPRTIKNLKVSIEARVDEDDYVHPIVSSSPNSIETLSYHCLPLQPQRGVDAFFSSSDEKETHFFGHPTSSSPLLAENEDLERGSAVTYDGGEDEEEEDSNDSAHRSSFLITVTGSYSSKSPSELIFAFTLPASPYVKTIDTVVKVREEINRKNENELCLFYSLWKIFHPFSSIPISCSIFPFVPSSHIKKSVEHHSKNEREREFLKGWATLI